MNSLVISQFILGGAALMLPKTIERRLKISIPAPMKAMFFAFLFCAVILGEVFDFYYRVPHWDDILHGTSGALTAYLGFTIVQVLSERSNGNLKLPTAFCAAFAFFFALSVGVVWELFEFSMDGLFGMNMQKAVLQSGEALAGHAAIVDTMKDIVVDCIGAITTSVVCCFSAKHKKDVAVSYAVSNRGHGNVGSSQVA
jgi:hypothetical protein